MLPEDIVKRLRKSPSVLYPGIQFEAADEIEKLRAALEKVIAWLDRLAVSAESSAKNNRFETMVEAYLSDAKNYRATAKDLRKALEQ